MELDWLRRNLLTVSGLLLAFAAFGAELANALPNEVGAEIAKWVFISTAAARGLVHAAQSLAAPPATATDTEQPVDAIVVD